MSWEYCLIDSLIALEPANSLYCKVAVRGKEKPHILRGMYGYAREGCPAHRVAIVCLILLPQPRLRRVSGLGMAGCAGRSYAVHKLPRLQHHT
jgi:hypothetical protein